MACVHDPNSGQKGNINADGVIEGGRLRRPGGSSVAGAMVTGLQKSKKVSSFLWSKRPFVARSAMSAASSRVCEGMWSQRARGRQVG